MISRGGLGDTYTSAAGLQVLDNCSWWEKLTGVCAGKIINSYLTTGEGEVGPDIYQYMKYGDVPGPTSLPTPSPSVPSGNWPNPNITPSIQPNLASTLTGNINDAIASGRYDPTGNSSPLPFSASGDLTMNPTTWIIWGFVALGAYLVIKEL